ncbi:hypothetical protein LWC34_33140 [Kibdelosporangium philippinense]|uniref:Uncharacterized protein n=1 Tax=Kibdelosporangium philippinense TaxID=211113 RepID=A0ABS8ZKI4_9PSEU|nr:hypothetical protein [Kibdelosporangium philippinense]MCE7007633.1 hypothetical protein [Kibdelosporangium philippinense]
MPDAAPVTSATSPVNSAGAPASLSLACSSSQYSTSNRSRSGSAWYVPIRSASSMIRIVCR